MEIVFIDHYDSFSNNLIDWFQGGADVTVSKVAFDDTHSMSKVIQQPRPIILSPGPKSPAEAITSVTLVRLLWGKVPMFGVCLGHQILAYAMGGTIKRSDFPLHGMTKKMIVSDQSGLFSVVPQVFQSAAYHSLTVGETGPHLKTIARCPHGEIQALEGKKTVGIIGVQFHPESFMSDDISSLRDRWIEVARDFDRTSLGEAFAVNQPSLRLGDEKIPFLSPDRSQ